MNRLCVPLLSLSLMPVASPAQATSASDVESPDDGVPYLKKNGAVTQLMVDGKPFVMLAGELHNSTASSIEYLRPLWKKLAALNLNTVLGTVSWELLEPEEGRFDFTLVDAQIRDARTHGMRLVLIWFGTWKNAGSSYVPLWVKRDTRRFPLMRTKDPTGPQFMGLTMDSLSPLGEASLAADCAAFRALMRHLREVDPQHTVIMVQVENEVGLLGDSRDRSPLAEAAWSRPVPAELMDYLVKHRANLLPELQEVWGRQGYKTSGSWAEVFGTDAFADEVFMAWHVGRYVGKVAEAGKAELPLPMYVNAWLGPQPGQENPGQYPSGGPVARVMDVWRAAAPTIDVLSPDIYIDDFKGTCALYARSGNPLFIPETRASVPNLFWAVGHYAALGYSPFGIEDLRDDDPLGAAYRVLGDLMPVLVKAQSEGRVTAVLKGEEREMKVECGCYPLDVRFEIPRWMAPPQPVSQGYGLLISTGPDELLVVGSGLTVKPRTDPSEANPVRIASVDEGRFEKGVWVPGRRLNGDELLGPPALPEGSIGIRKVKLYRRD